METPVYERRHLGGHPSVEAVVVPVIIIFLWFFISLTVRLLLPLIIGFYAVAFFRFALLVILMSVIDGRGAWWALHNMGFKRPVIKSLLFGLVVSVPMLIGTLSYIILSGRMVHLERGWPLFIPVLIVGPGFFEEGLFRGYIFNHFYTYSKLSWVRASLYSGIIFAISHLINVFAEATALDVFISVTFAIPVSFLFGFMFLRMAKNIWGCLSAHVALDAVSSVFVISGFGGLQFAVLFLSLAAVIIVGFMLTEHQYPVPLEEEEIGNENEPAA